MSQTVKRYRGLSPSEILGCLQTVAESGVSTPKVAQLLDVGTDDYLALLDEEFLQNDQAVISSTVRIYEGFYGAGKTHLTDLLFSKALDAGYVAVRTNLSDAIHLEDWKLVTRHVLQKVEARIEGHELRSLPSILQAAGALQLVDEDRLESYVAPHPGFKNASLQSTRIDPEHTGAEYLFRYLKGEPVGSGLLSQHRIKGVKNPLSERNAERILRTLAGVLECAGFRGLALLFDENEHTFTYARSTPPRRVVQAANLLRRMIDACVAGELPNTLVTFTVLPQFLENANAALPALGTRTQFFRNILPLNKTSGTMLPGWRFPIQEARHAVYPIDFKDWVNGVVDRYCGILEFFSTSSKKHEQNLERLAGETLKTDASDSVRRKIQKALATYTLAQVNEAYQEEDDFEDEDWA